MIRCVAFDLDNTLIDFMKFKRATAKAAARAMVRAGLKEKERTVYERIFKVYAVRGIEYQKTFSDVLLESGLGLNEFERIQHAGITAYLRCKFKVLRCYSGVPRVLMKLKKRGLVLAIVTDAPRNKAWQRLVIAGLDGLFNVVITHDDTKQAKPLPHAFKLLLQKTGLKAREVLFVGDNPERDVKGAKALGMHTALAVYGWDLNKNSKVKPEFKLKRFADVENVLEKLG